jgi:hypothetical protein
MQQLALVRSLELLLQQHPQVSDSLIIKQADVVAHVYKCAKAASVLCVELDLHYD